MGLPVKKLILATNENDEFPQFLKTGNYQIVEPSKNCISNAMNVGNPSNLARYFDLYKGNVDKKGVVNKDPNIEEMKENIYSVSVTDDETINTIKEVYKKYKVLIEPHGAVGIHAAMEFLKASPDENIMCLETADPAKFPEVIKEHLNIDPPIPENLAKLSNRKGSAINMKNNYQKLKEIITTN